MHRRAPIAIGVLLSLSFFSGLQTLLVMARNTVTTIAPAGPVAEVVQPDLVSPPIRAAVVLVPETSIQEGSGAGPLAAGFGAIVRVPVPVADAGETSPTDPVTVTPKPAPGGKAPPETPTTQPTQPIVVQPEPPVPVEVPPVEVPPVVVPPIVVPPVMVPPVVVPPGTSSGGSSKPPKSSIPLSSNAPPSSKPVPPISGAAAPPAFSPPLEVE